MIQRIQSLYLAMTTIFSILFLKGGILTFIDKSGSLITVTLQGAIKDGNAFNLDISGTHITLIILVVLISLLSLVTMFLFRNRKVQLLLSFSGIILSVLMNLNLFIYSYYISTKFDIDLVYKFKLIFPVLILVFSVLAYLGIRKDDRLIKSYDRLR
jgi:hypothetical protein